jgi:hypothetical protein
MTGPKVCRFVTVIDSALSFKIVGIGTGGPVFPMSGQSISERSISQVKKGTLMPWTGVVDVFCNSDAKRTSFSFFPLTPFVSFYWKHRPLYSSIVFTHSHSPLKFSFQSVTLLSPALTANTFPLKLQLTLQTTTSN